MPFRIPALLLRFFPSPHSDFQKYPDSQGHERSGDPSGGVQIGGATWGQGCKRLNKHTAWEGGRGARIRWARQSCAACG